MKTKTIDNAIFNSTDELREYLEEQRHEGTTFFEKPSFVKAITGITESGQLIYDYDFMIDAAMEETGWEYEDAVDQKIQNPFFVTCHVGHALSPIWESFSN